MILGLPLGTWVLMVLATVPGLALVGWVYVRHTGSSGSGTGTPGEERPSG